jgi:hypothetical protein
MIKAVYDTNVIVSAALYVRSVSYEECPSCGEKVLSPGVSQDLYEKIKHGEFAEETLRIPVLEGTYG